MDPTFINEINKFKKMYKGTQSESYVEYKKNKCKDKNKKKKNKGDFFTRIFGKDVCKWPYDRFKNNKTWILYTCISQFLLIIIISHFLFMCITDDTSFKTVEESLKKQRNSELNQSSALQNSIFNYHNIMLNVILMNRGICKLMLVCLSILPLAHCIIFHNKASYMSFCDITISSIGKIVFTFFILFWFLLFFNKLWRHNNEHIFSSLATIIPAIIIYSMIYAVNISMAYMFIFPLLVDFWNNTMDTSGENKETGENKEYKKLNLLFRLFLFLGIILHTTLFLYTSMDDFLGKDKQLVMVMKIATILFGVCLIIAYGLWSKKIWTEDWSQAFKSAYIKAGSSGIYKARGVAPFFGDFTGSYLSLAGSWNQIVGGVWDYFGSRVK
jgi:hypothetical protein